MSKYIIIHNGETIKHIERIGHNFTQSDIYVCDEIPQCNAPEGQVGTLTYTDADGLHYVYTDAPVITNVSEDYQSGYDQAVQDLISEGVL